MDKAQAALDIGTDRAASPGPLVFLIDDHPLVREALSLAAERAAPDARVASFASLAPALEALNDERPALVLVDLDLGDGGDLAHLTTLTARVRPAPVAVISATERLEVMRRARALGAAGYLRKSAGLSELVGSIKRLVGGDTVFPPELEHDPSDSQALDPALSEQAVHRLASLTPTQTRVLNALRGGLLNKQIAYEMDISEATVKAHMTAIFRKLGVQNRTQALLVAQALTVHEGEA